MPRRPRPKGKNWKTDPPARSSVWPKHGCHPLATQGARRGVELPRCHSAAPRAPVRHAAGPHGQNTRPTTTRRPSGACPRSTRPCRKRTLPTRCKREVPAHHESGRLVEYEGGGEETRSNPWLAELQQESFVEINPKTAADRGIPQRRTCGLSSPTGARLNVQALVTERVGPTRCGCRSTSRAAGRGGHAGVLPQGAAPHGAR